MPTAGVIVNETKDVASRPLTRAEVGELTDCIRQLLADPDARLTEATRERWQGALTALEAVLGEPPASSRILWCKRRTWPFRSRILV